MPPNIQKLYEQADWLAKDAKEISDKFLKQEDISLLDIMQLIATIMKRYSRLWSDLLKLKDKTKN